MLRSLLVHDGTYYFYHYDILTFRLHVLLLSNSSAIAPSFSSFLSVVSSIHIRQENQMGSSPLPVSILGFPLSGCLTGWLSTALPLGRTSKMALSPVCAAVKACRYTRRTGDVGIWSSKLDELPRDSEEADRQTSLVVGIYYR